MRRVTLLLLLIGMGACGGTDGDAPDHVVSFPATGTALRVRVADTDEERSQGLMQVRDLPADEGMAFVWGAPVESTFWMKDTLIPLSIAFIDAEGRILTLSDMEPCRADPCPTYAARGPFVMAVEANRGYFDEAGIAEGDRVLLEAGDG
jgi:uncharacterized membrane protein (UPF0127 family)